MDYLVTIPEKVPALAENYLKMVFRDDWTDYSARSGSVRQILDTPKFAIMKLQDGRKPAPASVINPLLGRRKTNETREAAGNPGSYRYFFDDSSFW